MFLVRICPKLLKAPVSFLIEFLAAIPSIAYGIWGMFMLTPFLQSHLEPAVRSIYDHLGQPTALHWLFQEKVNLPGGEVLSRQIPLTGSDMLCGGIVLAIMVVPIITAISRDVLRSVPRRRSKGPSPWARPGGKARGRCSATAARPSSGRSCWAWRGRRAKRWPSPWSSATTARSGPRSSPAQTMSSLLANEFAEASTDLHRAALTEVALILLVMSLLFNVVARYLVVGKGSRSAAAH